MTVLAAWCVGMTILVWFEQEKKSWLALAGVMPAALNASNLWALVVAAGLSVLMYFMASQGREQTDPRQLRAALGRFWQEVAVLLSAGLTFWQAVEVSAQAEPLLTSAIAKTANQLTRRSHAALDTTDLPGDDGQLSVLLLQHGYLHGVSSEQIQAHVRHVEERLAYEEEARKRRDPLWLTTLPALLLLNVLWVFVAPMIELVGRSWIKL
ncbi:MAG: hypothetical protein C7B45_11675 [Sulfobacillus acidophilus]|uniref:Type II secretion system protein GspF domain-containing protein n=1 Tax=Sulfobacillus acidophilus TaxID=53633 RepID=A0A2T2WGA5_9FIRM|nr:MAG: hypothetical protein C7B45_11675 [Sulfobacillus acidophilus]